MPHRRSLLDGARAAVERQDWQAAFDDASAAGVATDAAVEAGRLDLLADAAWWLGRLDDCIDAREAAYRSYDDLGDARRAGQCAVWLYEHHTFRAQSAAAGAWLRRARRSLEGDVESTAFGALLLREAELAHGGGDLDHALAVAQRVVELGRRLRSFDLEAEALQTAGRVLIDRGEIAAGLAMLDEAMLFVVEGRLGPYSTGKVYCSMIGACEDVGDFDRAAEWTEATQRWAQHHPLCIFPGICRVHHAIVLKRRGSLVEAQLEATQACGELARSRPVASAAAWIEVGDICRRLGDLERAESAFAKAQELNGSPCSALALLRLAQGDVTVAGTIIGACMDATTAPLGRVALLPNFVQIAVAAGDLDAAGAAVDELTDLLERFGSIAGHAALDIARGRVLLAAGDASDAAVVLKAGLERWRELDVPYETATAGTLLGQALRQCGREDAAAAAFTDAAALFDRIGAEIAELDPRAGPPARPELPAGLTRREVEVLRLVAAGLTNNDIAAALYLSAKTISRHLSNIFTKLGVTTRTAAAAFAFEHELMERPAKA
jgi:ATP/maltotriose-dependent transcriptional regulator MalT